MPSNARMPAGHSRAASASCSGRRAAPTQEGGPGHLPWTTLRNGHRPPCIPLLGLQQCLQQSIGLLPNVKQHPLISHAPEVPSNVMRGSEATAPKRVTTRHPPMWVPLAAAAMPRSLDGSARESTIGP